MTYSVADEVAQYEACKVNWKASIIIYSIDIDLHRI